MRIVILAYGTRGDVQPYIALGVGLAAAGYSVRIAAPAAFEPLIREYGLEFAPVTGDPVEISRALVDQGAGGPVRLVSAIIDLMRRTAAPAMLDVQAACQDADAILHSFHMAIPGHTVARLRNIPDIFAHVFPICAPTSAFPCVAFPELPLGGLYNRATHVLVDRVMWLTHRMFHGWLARTHPEIPDRLYWPFEEQRTPVLFGFSPLLLPPPPDWGRSIHVTGAWFLDPVYDWRPPAGLADFLSEGPPPVYIGFGSMVTRKADRLTEIVLEALRKSGQRAVLLSWGGTPAPAGRDGENVYRIDSAPHAWLFSRVSAVVHHGGAGTTMAGLRSGVPSIILPFTNEQPFWARQVRKLAVGPDPIPIWRVTADNLATAIHSATTDGPMRARAAQVGRQIDSEDGVSRAVRVLGDYLGGP